MEKKVEKYNFAKRKVQDTHINGNGIRRLSLLVKTNENTPLNLTPPNNNLLESLKRRQSNQISTFPLKAEQA